MNNFISSIVPDVFLKPSVNEDEVNRRLNHRQKICLRDGIEEVLKVSNEHSLAALYALLKADTDYSSPTRKNSIADFYTHYLDRESLGEIADAVMQSAAFPGEDIQNALPKSVDDTLQANNAAQRVIEEYILSFITPKINQKRQREVSVEDQLPVKKMKLDQEYDLDFAVKLVKNLSESLHKEGKKLCLFIGRVPGETFPGFGQNKPDNETWVSLDAAKNNEFIPGKQLHLVMDMNDREGLQRIHKLFDTVIVDVSTLKSHKGKDPWYSLGKLLRPQNDSQIIMGTSNFCMYPLDEIKEYMSVEDRDIPPYKEAFRIPYEKAKRLWAKNRDDFNLNKLRSDGCFSLVKLKSKFPFPYMYREGISHIFSYFVLTGPQPKLWK